MVSNPLGFIFAPHKQWRELSRLSPAQFSSTLLYPILFAVLPCVAWYYGTTQVGWSIAGSDEVTRLTPDSALKMIIAFYFAMLGSLIAIGWTIHWMSHTYGCDTSWIKGISIAGYVATPLFLAGLVGFYPLLWLDLGIGIIAISWAVYLLYTGVPDVMGIPADRGFLYASAVIAVCLVILVVIMGASVVLWDMGFMPVFTD